MTDTPSPEVPAHVPPPAPFERSPREVDVRASVEVGIDTRPVEVVLRRLPPPHLGNAYRNVFVETAALQVVTVPATGRSPVAPTGGEPGAVPPVQDDPCTPTAATGRPDRGVQHRGPRRRVEDPRTEDPRTEEPVRLVSLASAPAVEVRDAPHTVPARPAAGAGAPLLVPLSRRTLTVVVVLAGVGVLAAVTVGLVVLGAGVLFGGELLVRG